MYGFQEALSHCAVCSSRRRWTGRTGAEGVRGGKSRVRWRRDKQEQKEVEGEKSRRTKRPENRSRGRWRGKGQRKRETAEQEQRKVERAEVDAMDKEMERDGQRF